MSQETVCELEKIDLNKRFHSDGYHILAEQAVSLDQVYISDLSVKRVGEDIKCAVTTSEKVAEIFQLCNTQFKNIATLNGHDNHVTSVKFSPVNENILYTSSLDGKIKLWDLRNGQSVRELKGSGDTVKPLSCMDVSCNDRVLCAGTELVEGDAFLLFWDIRSRQLLGGYWESHTDDITSMAFHPQEPDTVASSSTDGLVNLFDLRESNEDDALQTSLNTESSVSRIRWNSDKTLSAITHTETVQLWDRDGAGPKHSWSRENVAEAFAISPDDCYVVDVHSRTDSQLFILAGSHGGKSESLQALPIQGEKVVEGLPLVGNRQVIRVSQFIPENDLLLTGGETGCLCIWKTGSSNANGNNKKAAKNRSKQKHKPY